MRLGIHIPLKGGFAANLMRVKEYGCETIQLFAGNPTAWKMAPPNVVEIEKRAVLAREDVYKRQRGKSWICLAPSEGVSPILMKKPRPFSSAAGSAWPPFILPRCSGGKPDFPSSCCSGVEAVLFCRRMIIFLPPGLFPLSPLKTVPVAVRAWFCLLYTSRCV